MIRTLITYDYGEERMKRLEKLLDLTYHYEGDIETFNDTEDVEVLICYNPFKKIDLHNFPNLQWIQLSSIGFDQLPLETVLERDIMVTNNQGGYSKPMGEFIIAKILEIYKHTREAYLSQQAKVWKMDTGLLELVNKKIVFLGTGTIAQEAAKRLQNWEMEIVGINTSARPVEYFDKCFSIQNSKDVLKEADIVVVALPHTKETEHIVDADLLGAMKDNAVLINISRGKIIDELALTDALNHGKFLGVALDVFDVEPLPQESPLWEFDNVFVTCHNSWISEMRNQRRFELIYENVKRYVNGQTLINSVDLERGY